jgi:D-apionolactonase
MRRGEKVELKAGALRVVLTDGELRYLRVGGVEVLRRVYVAVRDQRWRTIQPQISNLETLIGDDHFHVVFTAAHQEGEVDFRWLGTITGDANGTLSFTMEGEAHSTFSRNRIGVCVLYPAPECAGRPCRVEHTDGACEDGFFPQMIAPHQPFKNIRAIAHDVMPGLIAEVRMAGEVFEMEDQRNWTDGSYKVYSTPLDLPFPVVVRKGEKISQAFSLTLQGEMPAALNELSAAAISVRFDEDSAPRLLQIGLGAASHGRPLSERELSRLRLLNLSHLRVDLKLQDPDYKAALARAASEARGMGAKLELALFLSNDAAAELCELKREVEQLNAPVARWLLFHGAETVTAEKWVELARKILARGDTAAMIGAGTNQYFTELNRNRPPARIADVICYSINPQVHATDEDALVEALAAQAATVESARQFASSAPLAITPVTLKPRFNPHASRQGAERGPGKLPAAVDARQMSLFAAGWTLGSLKYLAESGAASVTYYETTGWRGAMETRQGSPDQELFPSLPGGVFPLWHVLADAGEFAGAEVIRTTSSEPLKVVSLALRQAGKLRLMLANLSGDPQKVWFERSESPIQVRRLNASNLALAISEPENFRAQAAEMSAPPHGGLELHLLPEEIVTLDFL